MSELEKKLSQAVALKNEVDEAQRALMLKGGMLDDLMKDAFIKDLGVDKDAKDMPLPTILMRVYQAGYLAGKIKND